MSNIDIHLLREKIAHEVEQWKEKTANHYTIEAEARWSEANHILGILDSLQIDTLSVESGKNMEEIAEEYSKRVSDGHNCRDLTCGFIAGAQRGAERFAKIVRANLPEIGNNAQSQFEQLYFEITGTKMYGGYND